MLPFSIAPHKLSILSSPSEYFNVVVSMIRSARQRLCLSFLYLGTGSMEQKLISEIEMTQRVNRTLQCALIFDKGRSERREKGVNSIDCIKQLTHYPNTSISLFQNPMINLAHCCKMPSLLKEMIGVYHTKAVISDNDILLTGANLSRSYFTDRTDRYFLLKDCKELSDHFFEYLLAVKALSYELKPNGKFYLQENRPKSLYGKLLQCERSYEYLPIRKLPRDEILVIPTNQLNCVGIRNEEKTLKEVFKNKSEFSTIKLFTGYCNLSDLITSKIGALRTQIYTSSPKANSFYKGGVIKGQIPHFYRLYEKRLLSAPNRLIELHEFNKPNWTFHSKGIVLYSKEGSPVITAVDQRAFKRDFETQCYFLSNNPSFSSILRKEAEDLTMNCTRITLDNINEDKEIKLKPYHYLFGNYLSRFL